MKKALPLASSPTAEPPREEAPEPARDAEPAPPADLRLPPLEQVLEYLLSFDLYEQIGNQEEGIGYARHHVDRFLKTLQYVPRLPRSARMLELGASPYFMSFLIMKYLGYEITPANYFGDYGETISGPHAMTVSSKKYGESHTFDSLFFNVETDRYPYPDASFDIVLCCEILEHLGSNPSHLLRESHRILKPGGYLMLSTPNAVRLENTLRMLRGENVYAPYSGYGIYGRHNREYSPWEVGELLAVHNFEPDVIVDDAYPHELAYRLTTKLFPRRRDNLFALGRKTGPTVERRPGWLFEHAFGKVRARTTYVIMGDEEHEQLLGGWSDLAYGPPAVRRVEGQAGARLLPTGRETRVGFHAEAPEREVYGRVTVAGHDAGEFVVPAGAGKDVVLPLPREALEQLRAGKVDWFDVLLKTDGSLPVEKIGLLE
jgi:SAM-dependent methyltransferase